MTGNDAESLAVRWQHHKQEETRHQAARREIEDQLARLYALPADLDGTETRETEHLVVRMVGRLDRKVDAEKVQELAAEHGVEAHLSTLFRWKPELNMRAWSNADERIRKALEGAITTKAGRPSFQVVERSEKSLR